MTNKHRVLLVGLDYRGPTIPNADVERRGLGRPEVVKEAAADALYEYNVIIIYPQSYSHFIFGREGPHSQSQKELWDLKRENNEYDLDTVFSSREREAELSAAFKAGSRVIWLMVPDKRIHFFGWRSLYSSYLNNFAFEIMNGGTVYTKRSKKLQLERSSDPFRTYFDRLKIDGWNVCISAPNGISKVLAKTPEGHVLGLELDSEGSRAWLLTPPASEKSTNVLIKDALRVIDTGVALPQYQGIFLCHATEDKLFVRKLKKSLERKGVSEVWVDEGELLIGDSLLNKIEEGINMTKYFGVVLSPRAIQSKWVKRELEIAMNREIESDEVIVLPLLYERCELPRFIKTKLYGDFTNPVAYKNSVNKLLRRLKSY